MVSDGICNIKKGKVKNLFLTLTPNRCSSPFTLPGYTVCPGSYFEAKTTCGKHRRIQFCTIIVARILNQKQIRNSQKIVLLYIIKGIFWYLQMSVITHIPICPIFWIFHFTNMNLWPYFSTDFLVFGIKMFGISGPLVQP